MNDQLKTIGVFHVKHVRNGVVIDEFDAPNTVTTQGKNHALDVAFGGATPITTWYIGLIGSSGYSATAAADTYAQINGSNGWDESAAYDEANRQVWDDAAASSSSKGTTTPAEFTINATVTIKGLFVAGGPNADDKSDATASGNVLWCATLFTGGDKALVDNDVLQVSYTITL